MDFSPKDATIKSQRNVFRKLTAFYIPLALQGAAQCLTLPLVGSVVSHGILGPDEYVAFSQGQTLMLLMSAIGFGLIPTGMVFGSSRCGIHNNHKLSAILATFTAIMQAVCSLPLIGGYVFGHILKLSPELVIVARRTILFSIPVQALFYLRNHNMAALFMARKSGLTGIATAVRLAIVAAISPVMLHHNLTGWHWGITLMTIPVLVENTFLHIFSMPVINALPERDPDEDQSIAHQFRFTLPLGLGGIVIMLATFVMAYFLARSADPDNALSIHYVIMALINPLSFAAARMNTVVLAFPPKSYSFRATRVFAIYAGLLLGLISLAVQIPSVGHWYFGSVQNLPPERIKMSMTAMLIMFPFTLWQALRGRAEGIAAAAHHPNAALAGNISFVAVLSLVLWSTVHYNLIPAFTISPTAEVLAALASFIAVHTSYRFYSHKKNIGDF